MVKAARGRKRSSGSLAAVARIIADEAGEDRYLVQAILSLYIEYLTQQLVVKHRVRIHGFGNLRTTPVRHRDVNTGLPTTGVRVVLESGKPLRRRIKAEGTMDKYAVDESSSEQLDKTAATNCPICGSKVKLHGSVKVCPKCGTEPFEEQR